MYINNTFDQLHQLISISQHSLSIMLSTWQNKVSKWCRGASLQSDTTCTNYCM